MERIYICAVDCQREEELASLLPPSFLKSAQKHRRADDRAAALACRRLLKDHLEGMGVDLYTLPLLKSEQGKPYLPLEGVHFSFAHSGGLSLLLVADAPCGGDLEVVDEEKDRDALAKRLFSMEESECYRLSKDKPLFFTTLWTKKEAEGKRAGTGVFPDLLKELDVSGCESYLLLYGGRRYCLSLSLEGGRAFEGEWVLPCGMESIKNL